MSNHGSDTDSSPAVSSNRLMDIIVGALMLALSSVFMFDSVRVGIGWADGQGPAAGFFPFWVSLIMAVASIVNIARAALNLEHDGADTFVTRTALVRVLTVLVPTSIYVLFALFMMFEKWFLVPLPKGPLEALLGLA